MKKFLVVGAIMLFAICPVLGQEKEAKDTGQEVEQKQEKQKKDLKKKLRKHQRSLDEAIEEFYGKNQKRLQKAMESGKKDEIAAIQKEMEQIVEKEAGAILELSDSAKDAKVAIDGYGTLLRFPVSDSIRKKIFNSVTEKYSNDKAILPILTHITQGPPSEMVFDFLKTISKKSTDKTIQANVAMAEISYLEFIKEIQPMIQDNPEMAAAFPGLPEFMKKVEKDLGDEAIMAKLKAVAEKYGEEKYRGRSLKKMIARKVKRMELRAKFQVGKVAPDIQGPDLDGVDFKLSDYRGKVVMLDFWGDW